jgi:serine/threonine protein kinase
MRLTDRKDIGVGLPNGTIVYHVGCLVEEHADGSITLHGRAEDVHYQRANIQSGFWTIRRPTRGDKPAWPGTIHHIQAPIRLSRWELPATERFPCTPSRPPTCSFRPVRFCWTASASSAKLPQAGMGTVFLATDEKLGQARAIKIARAGHARVLTPEAATALRVTHPNVCRVHEIHTLDSAEGPIDFLSMEFVDGETLAARLNRQGPLAPAEALAIALQICAGLAAAHAARLLHRDLKSSNILLDSTVQPVNRAVITDFGLAQDQDLANSTAAGRAGTPVYLSPERWAGEPASPASDIFALGIVLHEIYTGSRPNLGPGDPRMATRLVSSSVPASIRAVITRCLEPTRAGAIRPPKPSPPRSRRRRTPGVDHHRIGRTALTFDHRLALSLAHAGDSRRPPGRVSLSRDAISPRMPPNCCAAPASSSRTGSAVTVRGPCNWW